MAHPSGTLKEVARTIGVTRVARVTNLDRTGMEVACAIRPSGHVLQVCNGKGETFEDASAGAILEAADTSQRHLRKVFEGNPAWNSFIVSPNKGRYQLAEPIRQLVLEDQARRNAICWSVFCD